MDVLISLLILLLVVVLVLALVKMIVPLLGLTPDASRIVYLIVGVILLIWLLSGLSGYATLPFYPRR
jgi:hypothetical protein